MAAKDPLSVGYTNLSATESTNGPPNDQDMAIDVDIARTAFARRGKTVILDKADAHSAARLKDFSWFGQIRDLPWQRLPGHLLTPGDIDLSDLVRDCAHIPDVVLGTLHNALTWVVAAAASAFSLGVALAYSHVDWHSNFETKFLLLVAGGIFTSWNIAQYASFAIQTTGHQLPREHLAAILVIGLPLAACNLAGWALSTAFCTILSGEMVIIRSLATISLAIPAGVVTKMYLKLRFMVSRSDFTGPAASGCALSTKLAAASKYGFFYECPFQRVTPWLVAMNSAGPLTCFFWALMYFVGINLAYKMAHKLGGNLAEVGKWAIFFGTLALFTLGLKLLDDWLDKSKGFFSYSGKMYVAFFFIYSTISDLPIRYGVAQFTGYSRVVASFLPGLLIEAIRDQVLEWFSTCREEGIELGKHEVEDDSPELLEESNRKVYEANRRATRWLIMFVSIGLTGNVTSVMVPGLACIFDGNDRFPIGSCSKGFAWTVLEDAGPTWVLDLWGTVVLVLKGFPLFYYFSMLDHFIVIAVLVVMWLSVCLILFQAGVVERLSF